MRAYVTGIGSVTPYGAGVEAFWSGLMQRQHCFTLHSGPYPISKRSALVGRVPVSALDFVSDKVAYFPNVDGAGASSLFLNYAVLEAMEDAGLLGGIGTGRCALIVGNLEPHAGPLRRRPDAEPSVENTYSLAPARQLAVGLEAIVGSKFHCLFVHNTCASGNAALEIGLGLLKAGLIDTAIVAATDAFSERIFAGFETLGVVGLEPCRPFSKHRRFVTIAEGAAALILQSERNTTRTDPYAELLAVASSNDASHPTNPSSAGIAQCMAAVLEKAGLRSDQVDFIFAHGTGSRANDAAEGQLFERDYRESHIAATKGLTGHLMGVAGALGNVAAVMAAKRHLLPPNAIGDDELEYNIRLSGKSERVTGPIHVQNNAFGFGGTNAVSMFRSV